MMHIACAADAAYLPHCAAMLDSLFSHDAAGDLTVHFLCDELLPDEALQRLAGFVQGSGAGWQVHRLDEQQRSRFPDSARFGQVAWYRVLLPELLPEQKRVLYLDADVIIAGSLQELWHTSLDDEAVAAVTNPLYPFMGQHFMLPLGIGTAAAYFNSGVLLMQLDVFRTEKLTQRLLDFAASHGSQQSWPDQNALNAVLYGRCKYLAPRWNAQNTLFDLPTQKLPFSKQDISQARQQPRIIHFIGPYKPWHYRCRHPWRKLYWRHLRNTPWKDHPQEGVTLWHRLFRLLPEQFGWRLEAWLQRWLMRLRTSG